MLSTTAVFTFIPPQTTEKALLLQGTSEKLIEPAKQDTCLTLHPSFTSSLSISLDKLENYLIVNTLSQIKN